jgi:hypothetical protein
VGIELITTAGGVWREFGCGILEKYTQSWAPILTFIRRIFMSTLETVKAKTPAKRKKATTPKAKTVATPSPSREEIARLAEKYWIERGQPNGSAEQDWLRAERELIGMAS